MAVAGVAGTLLTQAALHVGPLRASQPFLVIVDPLVSIVLSVFLFGEYFASSAVDLATASISFVVLCIGVLLLTRTVPETMESPVAAAVPGRAWPPVTPGPEVRAHRPSSR